MTNYLAILAAGIFNMVLGFLWYGPLFAKPWMKFNGYTKEWMDKQMKGSNMGMKYGSMFVSSLVTAYVMSWLVNLTDASTVTSGAIVGGLAWLGFTATTQFANWNFSGKKFGAYVIDTGYFLVSFVVFGALFAVWK